MSAISVSFKNCARDLRSHCNSWGKSLRNYNGRMVLWRPRETKNNTPWERCWVGTRKGPSWHPLCLSKGQQPPSNLRWYSSWQRGTQLSKVAVCTTKLPATVTIGASPVELLALLDPNLMLGHQGHTILRLLLPASPDHRLSSTNSISKPTTKQLSNPIIYLSLTHGTSCKNAYNVLYQTSHVYSSVSVHAACSKFKLQSHLCHAQRPIEDGPLSPSLQS